MKGAGKKCRLKVFFNPDWLAEGVWLKAAKTRQSPFVGVLSMVRKVNKSCTIQNP